MYWKFNASLTKICVLAKSKDIHAKTFNIITNKNEGKTMTKYVSCHSKCRFNSTTCNSDQKWNHETCQCECKNYRTWKNVYSWNPSAWIGENHTSAIAFDESISVMDILSKKLTNTIAKKVSINSGGKKVRYKIDCYILLKVLLMIILPLIIIIISYQYAKAQVLQKGTNTVKT